MLARLFEKNTFDDVLFNMFIETRGAKGFIEHENSMGRKIDKLDIKEEMKKLIEQEDYKDRFQFYQVKKKLPLLLADIDYIDGNKDLIFRKALERVYEIVPEEVKVHTDVCLYVGGIDGGFTINRSRVFINYGKYLGNIEEFVKILSHELYHSRHIPFKHKVKFWLNTISSRKRHAYGILGKIVEEGIACLIQHGAILDRDDLTGNLTKRNLSHNKEQFGILNELLLNIKYGNYFRDKMNKLNVYSIGYFIVTTIYSEVGVLPLDNWTMNLDFKSILKTYNRLCIENSLPYCFNHEAIQWII